MVCSFFGSVEFFRLACLFAAVIAVRKRWYTSSTLLMFGGGRLLLSLFVVKLMRVSLSKIPSLEWFVGHWYYHFGGGYWRRSTMKPKKFFHEYACHVTCSYFAQVHKTQVWIGSCVPTTRIEAGASFGLYRRYVVFLFAKSRIRTA